MATFFDKNTNRFDKKNSLVPVWQRIGQGLVMPWEINQAQSDTSSQQQEASNANTLDTSPRQVQQPTWLQNPGTNEEQDRQETQQDNQDRNDSGYAVAASLENNQYKNNWFEYKSNLNSYGDLETKEKIKSALEDAYSRGFTGPKKVKKQGSFILGTPSSEDWEIPENVELKESDVLAFPEYGNTIALELSKRKRKAEEPERQAEEARQREEEDRKKIEARMEELKRNRQHLNDTENEESISESISKFIDDNKIDNDITVYGQSNPSSEGAFGLLKNLADAVNNDWSEMAADTERKKNATNPELQNPMTEKLKTQIIFPEKKEHNPWEWWDRIKQRQDNFIGPRQSYQSPLDSWKSYWADQFQKAEELNKQNEARLEEVRKQQEEDDRKTSENIKQGISDGVNYLTSGQLLNDIANSKPSKNISYVGGSGEKNPVNWKSVADGVSNAWTSLNKNVEDNFKASRENADKREQQLKENAEQSQKNIENLLNVGDNFLKTLNSTVTAKVPEQKAAEREVKEVSGPRMPGVEAPGKTYDGRNVAYPGTIDLPINEWINDFNESQKQKQEEDDNNNSVQILKRYGVDSPNDFAKTRIVGKGSYKEPIAADVLDRIRNEEGFDPGTMRQEWQDAYYNAVKESGLSAKDNQKYSANTEDKIPLISTDMSSDGQEYKDLANEIIERKNNENGYGLSREQYIDDLLYDENGNVLYESDGTPKNLRINNAKTMVSYDKAMALVDAGLLRDQANPWQTPLSDYDRDTVFDYGQLYRDGNLLYWEPTPAASFQSGLNWVNSSANQIGDFHEHEYTISIDGSRPVMEKDFDLTSANRYAKENRSKQKIVNNEGQAASRVELLNSKVDYDPEDNVIYSELGDGSKFVLIDNFSNSGMSDDELNDYLTDLFGQIATYNVTPEGFSVQDPEEVYTSHSGEEYSFDQVSRILNDIAAGHNSDEGIEYDYGPLNYFKPQTAIKGFSPDKGGWFPDFIPNARAAIGSSAQYIAPWWISFPLAINNAFMQSEGVTPDVGNRYRRNNSALTKDAKDQIKEKFLADGYSESEAADLTSKYVDWFENHLQGEKSWGAALMPLTEYGVGGIKGGLPKLFGKGKQFEKWQKDHPIKDFFLGNVSEGLEEIPGSITEQWLQNGLSSGFYGYDNPLKTNEGSYITDQYGNILPSWDPGFLFLDKNGNLKQNAVDQFIEETPDAFWSGALMYTALSPFLGNWSPFKIPKHVVSKIIQKLNLV